MILQNTDLNDKNTYTSSISNRIAQTVQVEAGGTAQIKVLAKVKAIKEQFEIKNLSNKAQAEIYGKVQDTSEEVTHVLKNSLEDVKNAITGTAWVDANADGVKDSGENLLRGIKVRLYDVSTNNYLKDSNGNIIETTTNDNGEYIFTKIPNGKYIVLFEYDTNKYEPTIYKKEEIDESKTSKVVLKSISINGQENTFAVTDTIDLQDNISNINIGLKEKHIFDMELNKYISRVVVQNSKGTKTYNYNNATFAKIEIHSKQLNGSVVVIEYSIKVKNTGEIPGFANTIVDYLPNGLTFSSELNPDWYLSGTKKLETEKINPGEEKEVKLILTKTMTNDNVGVLNNRAELYETYNELGNIDIDSTPNNQVKGEDDLGSADIIIMPSTGGTITIYIALIMINMMLIFVAIRLMIKNGIIKIKKERR